MSDVALLPCERFRYPVEGDLFNCERCGYWAEEHEADETQ